MKFKLKDIEANPFRDISHYPIRREKVEGLKKSIKETSFWDNLVARTAGSKAEIAYGHHRLVTLREMYRPDHEIELIIRELDDTTMLKIMTHENRREWGSSPTIDQENVRAVVKAYAEGKINLGKVPLKTNKSSIRYAPYHSTGIPEGCDSESLSHPYTTFMVAEFLGCTVKTAQGLVPNDDIFEAFRALEAQDLELLSIEDVEEMEQANATRSAIDEVSRAAKKVYASAHAETGSKSKAKTTARQAVKKLIENIKTQPEPTRDKVKEEAHRLQNKNGKEDGPPPTIDRVAVWAMKKFGRYLSNRDKDWPKMEELFRYASYIEKKQRKELAGCIQRLQGVLSLLDNALQNVGETNGTPKGQTIITAQQERKLLEVRFDDDDEEGA